MLERKGRVGQVFGMQMPPLPLLDVEMIDAADNKDADAAVAGDSAGDRDRGGRGVAHVSAEGEGGNRGGEFRGGGIFAVGFAEDAG